MTILFSSLAPVKPARNFGRGILATRPAFRAPYIAADLAWLAADNAARENAHYDAMADNARGLDLMERGIRPF